MSLNCMKKPLQQMLQRLTMCMLQMLFLFDSHLDFVVFTVLCINIYIACSCLLACDNTL